MSGFYPRNKEQSLSLSLFENPSSEYRGTPFWAWNNELKKDMLLRQIDVLHEMGFGGFHMHSRTGMGTDYLSDEFMEMVKACVDKAREDKMLAYLYDEDRWPSGFGGGLVTKDPAFRAHSLLFTPHPYGADVQKSEINISSAEMGRNENGTLLGVYDIVLKEDGSLASGKRISPEQEAVGKKWYAYDEIATESAWFNNQTYVDTLNPDAMDEFIRVTYERYLEVVGEDFGDTVPSIFTDEPQFSHKKTLNFSADEMDVSLPWTPDFAQTYQKAYGLDIMEHLPELLWDLPDGEASRARYCYHDHVCDRFTESFADRCGAWCREHGIALTGHMMEEPSLQSQTAALGEAMRSYRSFDLPGIDMLCDRIEFTTAKQAQSAVHQYGYEGMLSELYGVTGWDFDFRGHKFQGDWQAALGVTIRVPHLSWVSMAGEAKRDYPASISYQSPWYKEYSYVEDHFARVNTALTRGKPIVKVGVIHPVESCWLCWGPKEENALARQTLDTKFDDVTNWLLFGLYDFNYISESLLPSQCEKASNPLQVGKMAYDVVIVPDCKTLRSTTVERLADFAKAGGKVIFMGSAPEYIDAIPSDAGMALYESCTHISFDKGALYQELKAFQTVSIRRDDGTETDDLIMQYREDNDCRWLFVVHGKKPAVPDVLREKPIIITVNGCYKAERYNTLNGKVEPLTYRNVGQKTKICLTLHEFESLLIRLEEQQEKREVTLPAEPKPLMRRAVMTKVDYSLDEDNVLLLDIGEYALDEMAYQPKEELLRADNALRKLAGFAERGGSIPQPWVTRPYMDTTVRHTAKLRFTFESEQAFTGCKLALESAELAAVYVNGRLVEAKPEGYYVDESIGVIALPELAVGKNEIEVVYPFTEQLQIEWCYLLGSFAVRLAGTDATLVRLPEKLGFGSIVPQGFPFYTGNIRYAFEVEMENEEASLLINCYRGAAMRVCCDGEDKGMLVYPPYKTALGKLSAGKHCLEVTLYGNRFNGFGAVHNCNRTVSWHGPDAWRSIDDAFSYEYSLKELGILKAPEVLVYEQEK